MSGKLDFVRVVSLVEVVVVPVEVVLYEIELCGLGEVRLLLER